MGRTEQKLINYHSFGPLSEQHMPQVGDVEYGEIVVIHNPGEPLLGIKVGANEDDENASFSWFISSAAVVSAINAVDVAGTSEKISALSAATTAFSATVYADYATKSQVSAHVTTEIGKLDVDDIEGFSQSGTLATLTETDGKIAATFQPIQIAQSQVTGLETKLSTIEGDVTANSTAITGLKDNLSASVVTNYATKSEVSAHVTTEIGKLDVNNIEGFGKGKTLSALTETDGKISASFQDIEISKSQVTDLESTLSGMNDTITSNTEDIGAVSGSLVSLSANVITTIGTVYKVKGTVDTYDDLPTTDVSVGDVYNVATAQGTAGTADYVPAGTNYVWVAAGNGYNTAHWDALGGTVDLTGYATSAQTHNAIQTVSGNVQTVENALTGHIDGDFKTLSGNVVTLSGQVVTKYATSADTVNAINKAVTDLDWSGITANTADGYVISQISQTDGIVTASTAKLAIDMDQVSGLTALSQTVTNLASDLGEVSAVTVTALQEYKLGETSACTYNSTQSGAKAGYTPGGAAMLDLSELVIDCGDF